MKRSLGRGIASLAIAVSCASTCAELLDVGSLGSVTEQFCKCDGLDSRWPKDFEGAAFYTCKEHVAAALDAGTPEALAWIANFDEAQCDDCSKAAGCAQVPPLCIPIDSEQPCVSDDTCCGYDPTRPTASYCGEVLDENDETIDRLCVGDADPDNCAGSGDPCTEDEQCCGGAGALAECFTEAGLCVTQCDPDNPFLCPGCCALVTFVLSGDEYGLCVEGLPFEGVPENYCQQTCIDSCPLGLGCGLVDRRLEFFDVVTGELKYADTTVTECIPLPE